MREVINPALGEIVTVAPIFEVGTAAALLIEKPAHVVGRAGKAKHTPFTKQKLFLHWHFPATHAELAMHVVLLVHVAPVSVVPHLWVTGAPFAAHFHVRRSNVCWTR